MMTGDVADLFGMRVLFSQEQARAEGAPFLAKTTLPWDERLSLARDFAKSGKPAIIDNAFGSWFRSLAALKAAGVKEAAIVIPDSQNFLKTPLRTAVVVEEVKVIFLPIYKCGTSSFRALAHTHFQEFADRDASSSTSLNQSIDPADERYHGYKKFTFIREPMDRFGSFFRDKLLAPKGSPNEEHFIRPISVLMDEDVSAEMAAKFISHIPPEYCDPHIKPQWMTITSHDQVLPDFIFKLGDNERLKEIGIIHDFPKRLSTVGRKSAYGEDGTLPSAELIVSEYYKKDKEFWNL
ncbi:sulfotransferase family 2 domain-containing protein [Nitratireductor indicus]|uniref:sulfotransferase family 2 domain-containing protein n=1 Tax=Nitratireductor indicus TaxID=721133 RepID=UPI002875F81A|nr:sulfotransferase family 2 domain-containing protein [Nitratireductor indicus]MDS1138366.1 sulfotransferase family 2 domain-containing protein [Nitratireductor indicus]